MTGFLNIIKPTGVSSGYVVNKVKHILKTKVGHLGTLDPLASGVLPIAVGTATKFFDYFLNKDKEYIALMKFGVLTDTLDSEGSILSRDDKQISLDMVKTAASSLVGEIMQVPPIYSARSLDGRRGYELAKSGKKIELPAKKTQIFSISVEKWHKNDVFRLKIHCSAGTYIRSIVRDIAAKLNTVATCVAIIRTRSGPFKIDNAITLEELENKKEKLIIKPVEVLNLPELDLSKEEAKHLFEGKSIEKNLQDGEYLTNYQKSLFSLAVVENKKLKNKIYLFEGESQW